MKRSIAGAVPGPAALPIAGAVPGPAALPIALTRPDKVLFPEPGYTKRDLAYYYAALAPILLPFLRERPLVLKQYPNGIEGRFFFRQAAPRHAPDWLVTRRLVADSVGRAVDFVVANDLRSLVWVANQAAIELHSWLARVDRPDEPDLLVFDLDPGADLDLSAAREVALLVRERLADDGVAGIAKLSGKRGIHILVPLDRGQSFAASHAYARRVARSLAAARPDLVAAEYVRRDERCDRVLIDFAQNAHGKVTVAPYSVRPTPHATVSMPLPWSVLEAGTPDCDDFTIRTVPAMVAAGADQLVSGLARRCRLPR